jgi:hypothetical protein
MALSIKKVFIYLSKKNLTMKKIYPSFITVIIIVISFISKNVFSQVNSQDSLALVDFYNSTNGSGWTTKTNWLTGSVSTWYGISVSSNRVTTISLQSNNLTGSLPSSIGDLTELTTLDLGTNKIDDPVPTSISNLSKLKYLYLNSNELDSIPAEIGALINLEILKAGSNNLTELPEEMLDLINLIELRAESNSLTQFPYFVGSLTQLQTLWITGNNFNISFPDTLYKLVNIQALNISNCKISGSLDSRIANWPNLTHMYFQSNELSGSIPDEIGSLSNLKFLQLYNNNFEGEIPESIGNLSSLAYLRLEGNQLSGPIPDTIYSLITLKEIDLSDNYLSGTISSKIEKLTNLEEIYIYNDSLSGIFPSLDSLKNLEAIRIQNNDFIDFPDISSLTAVQYLYMENNMFTFEDLEPNMNVASSYFTYSPQDSAQNNFYLSFNAGDTLIILTKIGGTANQYQWYKNGSLISGANDDSLVINGVTSSNSGTYTCKVTNSIVSGLDIYIKSIYVKVNSITSTGSHQHENYNCFIFPNPSESGIYTLQSSEITNDLLSIYDINGQKITSTFVDQNIKQLDLSQQEKGIYSVKIENKNSIQTFIIVR